MLIHFNSRSPDFDYDYEHEHEQEEEYSTLASRRGLRKVCSLSTLGWWNWQTRTFEGRMPKGLRVQVPPRAPFEVLDVRRVDLVLLVILVLEERL